MRFAEVRPTHVVVAGLLALGLPAAEAAEVVEERAPMDHAQHHTGAEDAAEPVGPKLPEGMTLDEVLDRAAQAPPAGFPDAIHDNAIFAYAVLNQFEYRIPDHGDESLGWEGMAWIGYDYDRLWIEHEGEWSVGGSRHGETETDLRYSRLVAAFWNAQVGVRYANEWADDLYDDTWSAVVALLGVVPYMVEVDTSLALSENGDLWFEGEGEYDLRVTQRLVLQPRLEFSLFAQDIPERLVGAGLGPVDVDLRLRYEFTRRFAPYLGLRYHVTVGETADLVEAAGGESEQCIFLSGLRIAW